MAKAIPYTPAGGFTRESLMTASYRVEIAAPADEVFRLATTPSTWSKWNTSCTSASVDTLSPGTEMTMQARMNPAKPNSIVGIKAVVQSIETTAEGHKIVWIGGAQFPKFLMNTIRIQEVVKSPEDDNRCEYRTVEHMGGLLAYAIKYLVPGEKAFQLVFETWANDLREYTEQNAKSGVH